MTVGDLWRFCSLSEDSTCSERTRAIHMGTHTSMYSSAGLEWVQKDLGSSDLLQAELRLGSKLRVESLLLFYVTSCVYQGENI